jgi:hypothetical protein
VLLKKRDPVGVDSIRKTMNSENGRKRSVASTNQGMFRSVVDYDTEDQLRLAMMTAQCGDPDAETAAMIAAIREGQPVQKVRTLSMEKIPVLSCKSNGKDCTV